VAAQQQVNAWIIDWTKAQSEASLDEQVAFPFVKDNKAAMKRGEMFLHLVTHGSIIAAGWRRCSSRRAAAATRSLGLPLRGATGVARSGLTTSSLQ
jgi:hypothetical protein